MQYTTLDRVVRGYLLKHSYPIHFYVTCLAWCQGCFEDLSFNVLGNIRTVKLAINAHGSVKLPEDFLDLAKIGVADGQFVRPLSARNGFSRLVSDEDADTMQPYGDSERGYTVWGLTNNYNSHGEFLGRLFGVQGANSDGFKIIPERNEIQLDNNIDATHVIIEYITDGRSLDNATKIHPYARKALETYMAWQWKETGRSYGEGERMRMKRLHDAAVQELRGMMNPMTINDFKAIVRKRTHGSIKG